jgi:hypothetical protein
MKKNLLLAAIPALFINICVPFLAQAQSTLANMDFENWQRSSSNKYDEPTGGVWATPNATLDAAFGTNEAPVQKATAAADVQHGVAAAKLKTVTLFGLKAAGTLFTGKFVFNLTNPTSSAKLGVPFTARPDRFRGYYKCSQVNGDSTLMYARLIRRNPTSGQREQVGIARQVVHTVVSSYTLFDLPFVYDNAQTPDSIIVVFTSSAAADNLSAPQVGSTMFVDNTELVMPVGTSLSLFEMVATQTFPNPATNQLTLETSAALRQATLQLWATDGKLAATFPLTDNQTKHTVSVAELPIGNYIYNIIQNGAAISVGKIEVIR